MGGAPTPWSGVDEERRLVTSAGAGPVPGQGAQLDAVHNGRRHVGELPDSCVERVVGWNGQPLPALGSRVETCGWPGSDG